MLDYRGIHGGLGSKLFVKNVRRPFKMELGLKKKKKSSLYCNRVFDSQNFLQQISVYAAVLTDFYFLVQL